MGTGALTVGERTSADQRISFADCWISDEAQRGRAARAGVRMGHHRAGVPQLRDRARGVRRARTPSPSRRAPPALELALRSLGLHAGRAVLTSTMTFCGRVHAIEHAGLRPVLVDVDPVTGMPTEDTVARAAGSCGESLRRWSLVHWAGDPFDRAALAAAAGLPRGPRRGGRRARPRRRARGEPRWAPDRWPASASTPRRTCRSGRAGWSPPTTRAAPPGCDGPGCTG